MGIKLWSTGELLTAADVNAYLMKQSIIVCTSGTHPASPVEGMTVYETDTDRYSSWNGSTWLIIGQTVTGTYTPTLTATTTNPTLGTGGIAEGRFTLWGGKWAAIRGTIRFGTSGANAGSGQYLIALPQTSSSQISNGVSTTGSGVVRAAGSLASVTFYCTTSATSMAAITSSGSNLSSGTPGVFTNNDYISFSLTYEQT